MSGNNIIRLNVDRSNLKQEVVPVDFNIINSTNFIDNAADYEVYIEKSEIPIPENLPLLVSADKVKITFEATDKDDKASIFAYDEIFKTYELSTSYKDLDQIVREINNIIYTTLGVGFQWCKLAVIEGSKLSLEVLDVTRASKTRIWIDMLFYNLFEEFPRNNPGYDYQGHEYFEIVSSKPVNFVYEQYNSYVGNIFNLKSFRIFSTLPTEAFWLYDQNKGTMVQSNLLGEVVYNTKEMSGNTNLLYIPSVFRYSSMTDAGSISKFSLNVSAYYFNGIEIPLTMDQNGYISITLVFERKIKI